MLEFFSLIIGKLNMLLTSRYKIKGTKIKKLEMNKNKITIKIKNNFFFLKKKSKQNIKIINKTKIIPCGQLKYYY